jgi:hypothetical protein
MMLVIQNRADANNMAKSGMTSNVARSKNHFFCQELMV